MKPDQIKQLINDVIDGVDKSKLGPVLHHPDAGDISRVEINQVAWAACAIILTQLFKQK